MLCTRHLLYLPGLLVLDHGIQHRQALAHAGRPRNLLDFARGAQALVKGFAHRIIADGHEGTHGQGSPHRRAPPKVVRVPRREPLSRLNGATPTRAAMRWRLKVPTSGRSSPSVRAHTGPMPGPLRETVSRSHQTGLARCVVSKSFSRAATRCLSQAIGASISVRRRRRAFSRRFCSAGRSARSCRRRARRARSSAVCASGSGRGAGRTASAQGATPGHRGQRGWPTAPSLAHSPVLGEDSSPRGARRPQPAPRPRPGGSRPGLRAQSAWAGRPGARRRGPPSLAHRSSPPSVRPWAQGDSKVPFGNIANNKDLRGSHHHSALARPGRMRARWRRTTVRARGGQDATPHAPLRSRRTQALSVYHVRILGDGDAPTSPIKIQG